MIDRTTPKDWGHHKHKTVIVSTDGYYRAVCLLCNAQWHEDGTLLWKENNLKKHLTNDAK